MFEGSISSRLALARGLRIEALLLQNKARGNEYRSMLEIIVGLLLSLFNQAHTGKNAMHAERAPNKSGTRSLPAKKERLRIQTLTRPACISKPLEPTKDPGCQPDYKSSDHQGSHEDEKEVNIIQDSAPRKFNGTSGKLSTLVVSQEQQGYPTRFMSSPSEPLNPLIHKEIHQLIFGCAKLTFPSEWTQQAFQFSECDTLQYGLVQKKGGPCGILAVVQAHIIKHLFHSPQVPACSSHPDRHDLLIESMADILTRASDDGRFVVALLDRIEPPLNAKGYIKLGKIRIHQLDNRASVSSLLLENIHQFTLENLCGPILLLYSVILSKGIESIKLDMDDPNITLIGRYGYCSQELVNLILTGRARSNVFDGQVQLGFPSSQMLLKGTDSRAEIGFLSIYDSEDYGTVGSYLKDPEYPIWIVFMESHYSVLFSKASEPTQNSKIGKLDLFFYDCFGGQTEEIRLTVDTTSDVATNLSYDPDLVPPLNTVIRTRWKQACIDWNGTDPLI